MWKALAKIFESASLTFLVGSLCLVLVGLALFSISALGAIPMTTNTITDPWWRVALAILGLVVATGGATAFWYAPSEKQIINAHSFGLKINHPQTGDIVGEHYDVSGTYGRKPPNDYEIIIFEVNTDGHSPTYRPRKVAVSGPDQSWRAKGVYGGDLKELGRERTIFVALVGNSGQALCDYYHKVGETYNFERRPSIDVLASDIIECDRIRVRRG